MDVSIILVNYNTQKMTSECIDSIFKYTKGVSFEIILVDNNSKDGSSKYFANDKRVKFIEAGDNLGFGRANNLGLKYATGKYIFFLNTDTLLLNNAVKLFFDYGEAHLNEKIGGVGCLLLGKENQVIHSFAKFPTITMVLYNSIFNHILGKFGHYRNLLDITHDDTSKPSFHVDYVTGADLFVAKKVIDECGAFDPDFFMYYEETEMQHRWGRKGYTARVIKTPSIIHLAGMSTQNANKEFNWKKDIIVKKSELKYFKKTCSVFYYWFYRICFFTYLIDPIRKRKNKQYIKELLKLTFI